MSFDNLFRKALAQYSFRHWLILLLPPLLLTNMYCTPRQYVTFFDFWSSSLIFSILALPDAKFWLSAAELKRERRAVLPTRQWWKWYDLIWYLFEYFFQISLASIGLSAETIPTEKIVGNWWGKNSITNFFIKVKFVHVQIWVEFFLV